MHTYILAYTLRVVSCPDYFSPSGKIVWFSGGREKCGLETRLHWELDSKRKQKLYMMKFYSSFNMSFKYVNDSYIIHVVHVVLRVLFYKSKSVWYIYNGCPGELEILPCSFQVGTSITTRCCWGSRLLGSTTESAYPCTQTRKETNFSINVNIIIQLNVNRLTSLREL